MSNELHCMNCSIMYFKDSLCDCDNGICKEFKRIGGEGDFEKDVLARIEPSWTPITESEPNTIDHVLVTYKWSDDDYEVSEMDYWVTKYGAEHGDKWCEKQMNHVIAWREKPKPYKEKR